MQNIFLEEKHENVNAKSISRGKLRNLLMRNIFLEKNRENFVDAEKEFHEKFLEWFVDAN